MTVQPTADLSAAATGGVPTSADAIAMRLHAAGVRHAFGVPGGEVLALIEALERNGIAFHLARHENAAGFMAEAAWHATGAPAVLVATVGPGIANAVNVIANAQQDRVPLIALSGRIPEAQALTYSHQVMDHQAVLRPLVKASFEARAGACAPMIDKAVRLALDPRPGPVHIDLPIPVAAALEPGATGAPLRPAPALSAPAPGPALERAREMFARAERPVILAGLDLLTEPGAVAALRDLSARCGIPVATTYKAKGALPEDDPLSLGGHGLSPRSDAEILPLLGAADMVICAGYDPIEMRAGWRDPWDPARAIEIAAAPDRQYLHHATLSWTCGIAAGVEALGAGLAPAAAWPDGAPARVRAALREAFAPDAAWGPAQALHVLNEMKPEGCVTTVDSGAHRILLSQIWTCAAPRELLQSSGLCTMGCALPLAVGAKLARPEAPVLCVIGDGCLDMTLGELATLRDLGRPVVVVVLVDGALELIALKQRGEGRAPAGVAFGRTDYAAVARALGGRGETVRDAPALRAAFAQALSADRFTVIAAEIPPGGYDGRI
ncbi:thiamine pyrophosphate-binding protein [Albimonas sp. CAU 1670]|uniref:thiamine pyrophosphate-binding protein n=1 Tax=Albimonas sp. CAU 1670 TaxID=3032599 RepID=UPI0023DBF9F9|nr:thiamine pyrophosphate-binding protein [Albimonas sp. CAU 1670]MDF2232215.1 thiamine pyrophosphate-binding protein [Albimonas sp. CAU 1670]